MQGFYVKQSKEAIPIQGIQRDNFESWLEAQPEQLKNWVKATGFEAKSAEICLVPDDRGHIKQVLMGMADSKDTWAVGGIPTKLPAGDYYLTDTDFDQAQMEHAAIAWGLGCYQFTPYKKHKPIEARLVLPKGVDPDEVDNRVRSTYLVRDLINTPTEDLGPAELAEAVESIAEEFGAEIHQIIGDDLLEHGYPAVHAVGRASSQHPRLLDMRWGKPSDYTITLVGKGVCFDSGGLDLKPPKAMEDMKKDMGGAAHALGVARAIMAAKLPVNLRLLIPAVENSVSGDAYRPGDIIRTRKGITVEVTNTDAEGRLILCDALAEAVKEEPQLLVDFATLTGAARIALGPDISAMFTHHDQLAEQLLDHGERTHDPLNRLPLFKPYRCYLDSKIADICNAASKPYGGAITAALFLSEFVPESLKWVHFDIMASNIKASPGRPEGGEAMGLHAVYSYIKTLIQ